MSGDVKVMVVATGFESFDSQKKDVAKMNSAYKQNEYISRMNHSIKDITDVSEDIDEIEFEEEKITQIPLSMTHRLMIMIMILN